MPSPQPQNLCQISKDRLFRLITLFDNTRELESAVASNYPIIHSEPSTMHSHLATPIVSLPLLALLALLPTALCHGHQVPISDDADWATRHMAEEHHIANLDPSAFFALHDYDSSGQWSPDEIRRTYGLDDESAKDVPQEKKTSAVQEVVQLFDKDGDGAISREEWMDGWIKEGKRLPDLGTGPGHHGDDEYEYEIHHFEKFHDENTREEDLTHPEDIAHFRKHDEMDAQADFQEQMDQMPIVEHNIPQKFRRY